MATTYDENDNKSNGNPNKGGRFIEQKDEPDCDIKDMNFWADKTLKNPNSRHGEIDYFSKL